MKKILIYSISQSFTSQVKPDINNQPHMNCNLWRTLMMSFLTLFAHIVTVSTSNLNHIIKMPHTPAFSLHHVTLQPMMIKIVILTQFTPQALHRLC